ncbi:type II secretion system F family protein [Paenibacillus puerhi]|uniref:type II secretion system F family protein n=1 Tax=Paenibacillus puerhi TaxID=2692622 RepID=UPI00135696B4|nr:type II secretion system F family protein [Paenibacillus puerhi]
MKAKRWLDLSEAVSWRSLPFTKKTGLSDNKPFARLTDYEQLELSARQQGLAVCAGALLCGALAWVFYRHPVAVALFAFGGLLFPAMLRKHLLTRRKAQLKIQFKQLLSAVSTSLGAGKSIETAFRDAMQDLHLLYPDSSTMIIRELEIVNRRLDNGESIESALLGFAQRAGLDEIGQFTDVFVICKRTGGSLVQVVRRTSMLIQEKLDIEQDLSVTLAQKKFEAKLLSAAPVAFVAMMAWTAPDYMEPLYEGSGRVVMTAALAVLGLSTVWIRRIMNIRV